MELLGDETQVEARFDQFGDCDNLDIDRCMVCTKRTSLRNSFGRIPWYS
jgi:hypothetical protein